MTERVLVIAPHPDDEVLGVGGTIARMAAAGDEVAVVILTRGQPPAYTDSDADAVRAEAEAAHAVLGVSKSLFLTFPAARLDTVPHHELNAGLQAVFEDVGPSTVFIPFNGDVHLDHQAAFASAMVCARPSTPWSPRRVLAYETLSETNWNAPPLTPQFAPNVFVDVSAHLDAKLTAFQRYSSQVRAFPHERSIEALDALARLRGATVGRAAAEAFVLVRALA